MASIGQIQIVKYSVEASVDEILKAWGSLSPEHRNKLYPEILKSHKLGERITFACEHLAEANYLIDKINAHADEWSVKVASYTQYGLTYDVKGTANEPRSCSCPDFEHRGEGNPGYMCKHMRSVKWSPARYGLK